MDTDRNLLFGVLALQAELIDTAQFVEACTIWSARKQVGLAEILTERGWILPEDRHHVDYLLERKLKKHAGDARASLAAVPDDVKRSLAAVPDEAIRQSLGHHPEPGSADLGATLAHIAVPTHARYALTRLHATGGIGRIWLARDRELGRQVALKELRPEWAQHTTLARRFVQEARITGQLEHPGIVPVYEMGRYDDSQHPFYTMRFVKGPTLSDAARSFHRQRQAGREEMLDFPVLLNAFVTVANTIAYAHSRGILHRDLKGQNVVLGNFGEVVLLDWGLAKVIDQSEEPDGDAPSSGHDSTDLTMQGQAVGTPAFMSPEQAAGERERIDHRSDVYGLGAILYEILTGQEPFSGADTAEVLRKVREEDPVLPRTLWPEVPRGLETVCLRALAKNPADRPAAAADLAREVQAWQEVERQQAEAALRDSEALYHSLVETLPLGVYRKDLQGRFTFANKSFCDGIGMSLAQLLGKTDFDLFPAELAAKYRRDDRQVEQTGTTVTFSEDHLTLAGQELYVQCIKSPIHDSHGKLVGTQGIFWDITERKRAEEERDRFFTLSVDMLGVANLDGYFTRVNPAFERTLGYSSEEFMRRPFFDFLHPDDRERTAVELAAIASGKTTHLFENRYRCKDGSYKWLSWTATPYRDGAVRVTYAAARDITAQKQAEHALRESEERYRSVIAAMQTGIILWDAAGNYMSSNASAERILGLSAEQLQQRGTTDPRWQPIDEAGNPFPVERYPTVITLRTGQPVSDCVLGSRNPDGSVMWISINSQPLLQADGKSLAGVVASFEDITERKRLETEVKSLQQRERSNG